MLRLPQYGNLVLGTNCRECQYFASCEAIYEKDFGIKCKRDFLHDFSAATTWRNLEIYATQSDSFSRTLQLGWERLIDGILKYIFLIRCWLLARWCALRVGFASVKIKWDTKLYPIRISRMGSRYRYDTFLVVMVPIVVGFICYALGVLTTYWICP